MKKLFLMMGLASLFMVACNNAPKEQKVDEPQQQEVAVAEEHQCPFGALKAEYANWETMEEAAKVELNNRAIAFFAEMDAKMEEMKAEGKACCEKAGEMKEGCEQKMAEMTEEMKAECEAKCAEMKAQMDAIMEKWANIETMTNDEVKDLVLSRIAAMSQCHHEGEEHHCCKHEGEEHQCQHGEGHQCQHGEGHQCQHAGEEGHQCQHHAE